mgnify:CR=1 FL=1
MSLLLTPRQGQLLEFLQRFIEHNGAPPTRAEIAAEMGFRSPNAAEEHLKALARKGAIELVPGTSRGIRLRQAGLPLVGRVAAGSPILAEQHIEEYYQIEAGLFYPAADYLLRVRGTSMRDAGILDGDLLAVHRSDDAANGQIVVARIDDEVTVKRFRRRGNQVWLLPENPEFEPIKVDLNAQPLSIEGIGVGVIRNGKM